MEIRKWDFCKLLRQQKKYSINFLRQRKNKIYSAEELFLAMSPSFYDELAEKFFMDAKINDFLYGLKIESRKTFFEYLSDEQLEKIVCDAPDFIKYMSTGRLERFINTILYNDVVFLEFAMDVRRLLELSDDQTFIYRLLIALQNNAIITKLLTDSTEEIFGENNFEKLIQIFEFNPQKILYIFQNIAPDSLFEAVKKCKYCVLKNGNESGLNSYICNTLNEADLNELLQDIKKSGDISISDVFSEEEIAQLEKDFMI